MDPTVTYASIVTPLGEGGIGIIALWGPEAVRVLGSVFAGTKRQAAQLPVGAIAHGTVRSGAEMIDEVIVARLSPPDPSMDGPYFEVNCHGGVVAVRTVLGCLEEAGAQLAPWSELAARPAGPPLSEGTIRARAFDELLRAPTRLAAIMLLHQADGTLNRELDRICDMLARGDANEAGIRLDALARTAPFGRALLSPPRVAMLGPPNAGKSTLFNALLEEERVIVHQEPGTTRDTVCEVVSIRGVPFELVDAAGIGQAHDEVQEHAVGRARALAQSCDVALLVFDVREGVELECLPTPDARVICVANKIDLLADRPGHAPAGEMEGLVVRISAKDKTNIEELETALLEPYQEFIEPCRAGGPIVFDQAMEEGLRRIGEKLETDSADAALTLLRRLRSEGREAEDAGTA